MLSRDVELHGSKVAGFLLDFNKRLGELVRVNESLVNAFRVAKGTAGDSWGAEQMSTLVLQAKGSYSNFTELVKGAGDFFSELTQRFMASPNGSSARETLKGEMSSVISAIKDARERFFSSCILASDPVNNTILSLPVASVHPSLIEDLVYLIPRNILGTKPKVGGKEESVRNDLLGLLLDFASKYSDVQGFSGLSGQGSTVFSGRLDEALSSLVLDGSIGPSFKFEICSSLYSPEAISRALSEGSKVAGKGGPAVSKKDAFSACIIGVHNLVEGIIFEQDLPGESELPESLRLNSLKGVEKTINTTMKLALEIPGVTKSSDIPVRDLQHLIGAMSIFRDENLVDPSSSKSQEIERVKQRIKSLLFDLLSKQMKPFLDNSSIAPGQSLRKVAPLVDAAYNYMIDGRINSEDFSRIVRSVMHPRDLQNLEELQRNQSIVKDSGADGLAEGGSPAVSMNGFLKLMISELDGAFMGSFVSRGASNAPSDGSYDELVGPIKSIILSGRLGFDLDSISTLIRLAEKRQETSPLHVNSVATNEFLSLSKLLMDNARPLGADAGNFRERAATVIGAIAGSSGISQDSKVRILSSFGRSVDLVDVSRFIADNLGFELSDYFGASSLRNLSSATFKQGSEGKGALEEMIELFSSRPVQEFINSPRPSLGGGVKLGVKGEPDPDFSLEERMALRSGALARSGRALRSGPGGVREGIEGLSVARKRIEVDDDASTLPDMAQGDALRGRRSTLRRKNRPVRDANRSSALVASKLVSFVGDGGYATPTDIAFPGSGGREERVYSLAKRISRKLDSASAVVLPEELTDILSGSKKGGKGLKNVGGTQFVNVGGDFIPYPELLALRSPTLSRKRRTQIVSKYEGNPVFDKFIESCHNLIGLASGLKKKGRGLVNVAARGIGKLRDIGKKNIHKDGGKSALSSPEVETDDAKHGVYSELEDSQSLPRSSALSETSNWWGSEFDSDDDHIYEDVERPDEGAERELRNSALDEVSDWGSEFDSDDDHIYEDVERYERVGDPSELRGAVGGEDVSHIGGSSSVSSGFRGEEEKKVATRSKNSTVPRRL